MTEDRTDASAVSNRRFGYKAGVLFEAAAVQPNHLLMMQKHCLCSQIVISHVEYGRCTNLTGCSPQLSACVVLQVVVSLVCRGAIGSLPVNRQRLPVNRQRLEQPEAVRKAVAQDTAIHRYTACLPFAQGQQQSPFNSTHTHTNRHTDTDTQTQTQRHTHRHTHRCELQPDLPVVRFGSSWPTLTKQVAT